MSRPARILTEPTFQSRRRGPRPAWGERAFAGRAISVRAWLALVRANAVYWTTVAPIVRVRLAAWELRAEEIPDSGLRTLATSKLEEERFNVEVAATLATLAPGKWRKPVVETIVALQVLYDYLDLVGEQPLADPLADGKRLFAALIEAVTPGSRPSNDYYPQSEHACDGGYLRELVETVLKGVEGLPSIGESTEIFARAAERCAAAQTLVHAVPVLGDAALEAWATRQPFGGDLWWPERLAGASASILAMHALIAMATDADATRGDADQLDQFYLSVGVLTMLDSLIDQEHDSASGEHSYSRCYENPEQMARRLTTVAHDAVRGAGKLKHAGHHVMTLVGVVAYYLSAPTDDKAHTGLFMSHMRKELRPLMTPTLAIMKGWRMAKRRGVSRP